MLQAARPHTFGMATPNYATRRAKKLRHKYLTWEHPKGSGIKIAEMPNRTGGKAYGVSYQVRIPAKLLGVPGKRGIHQRGTKQEAERLAEDRFIALRKHGTEFSKIPAEVQRQAAIAWSKLAEHNAKQGLKLSLLEVVDAGISVLSPIGGQRTFAEVCIELRNSKSERLRARSIDQSTERDFRRRSLALENLGLGSRLVSEITRTDVLSTLSELAKTRAQRTVLNFRNTLAEVFNHAKARQYCPSNPLDGLTTEDRKRLGGEKAQRNLDGINILKVDEARRLLRAAHESGEPGMLATTALRLFCGLRTAEATRVDWSEVHWLDAKPYVHIPAGKAKGRRNRHVSIPENAVAWLRLCNPPAHGKVDPQSPKTYTKRYGRITRLAEIGHHDKNGNWKSDWESNDTRHSYGSYHYALNGNSVETAKQMGHKHGDEVLFNHYRTLVSKDAAEEYFSIMPDAEAGIVTPFPAAAQG